MVFPLVWITEILYIKVMVVLAFTCAVSHRNSKCPFKSTDVLSLQCDMRVSMGTSVREEVLRFTESTSLSLPFSMYKAPTCQSDSIDPTRELQKEPFCIREGYHRL